MVPRAPASSVRVTRVFYPVRTGARAPNPSIWRLILLLASNAPGGRKKKKKEHLARLPVGMPISKQSIDSSVKNQNAGQISRHTKAMYAQL